jgi:hypothetical protein
MLSGLSLISLDAIPMCYFRVSVAAVLAFASVCMHAQDRTSTPAPGGLLLHPSQIVLTSRFEAPLGPPAIEGATRTVGEQIDAKRAADAARSQFSPIWNLSVWRYLPADPIHTLNSRVASDDDPFFTPEYLKVSARRLDYELGLSERATHDFLH